MLAHQGVDGRVNCWMYAFLVPGTTPTAANAALSTAMVLVPNAADGWLAVDDEVVVYDVRAQACHVFEGVAALAWQCLDGDGSIDDILTDFADIFEVDLELVQQDLVPLFTDGFEKELIVENHND